MKKTLFICLLAIITQATFAQRSVLRNGKLSPNVSTKTLKKLLASNYERKSYRNVVLISDTLLKRNRNDKDTRQKRAFSEIKLKLDQKAIADIKLLDKNKDTAATSIASVPINFIDVTGKRAELYLKAAMAYAPKNGIPYLLKAAVLADEKKPLEASAFAEKGWALLGENYKPMFLPVYAQIQHESGKQEQAYQLLSEIIENGTANDNTLEYYFGFFIKDGKIEEGIERASAIFEKTNDPRFLKRRAHLYNKNDNKDKACEDATKLKELVDSDSELLEFGCPQILANVKPEPARTYIYKVNFQGRDYDFRVTNPVVDMDNGAKFRFKMTGDNSITGRVSISKEALATAHDQNNNFANGDLDLTDKTTVWISKEVFKELKENGASTMGADSWGAKEYKMVEPYFSSDNYYPVNIDGKTLYIPCIKVASEDGQEIWIADDESNPLILKMDISFTIELVQVI